MPAGRCDLVLADVTLPDGRVVDLSISDGLVCHAGAPLGSDVRVSCRGRTVLPAAIDMHVHMRGGSQNRKEDWRSGSQSALAGGVTIAVDQPNTVPPLLAGPALRARRLLAAADSWCGYAINGGVAKESDLSGLWDEGALAFGEIFAGPSSYGEQVDDSVITGGLRQIGEFGALATFHAEQVRPGEAADLVSHNNLRGYLDEAKAVGGIVKRYGRLCRIHFCHASSAEAIRAAGPATVEVAPHHLFLSIEGHREDDGFLKVNPPLRPEAIRRSLFATWSRIDVIASDHAPHTVHEKELAFPEAPSGIPGVETMLPLLMAAWQGGRIDLASIIGKTSWRPADILGIRRAGFSPGMRADFAVYGGAREKISADRLHSRAGWTPYEGMEGLFPERVVMQGRLAYDRGEFSYAEPAWYAGRGYHPPGIT